jgi:hypothetical protein
MIMVFSHIQQSGIQYVHVYSDDTIMARPPCFLLPRSDSLFASLPFLFTYLETLLDVIGSCPPWSQVARKLISPFPSPPHSKIPTPWGFPELSMHLTKTTSRIWLPRSGTFRTSLYFKDCSIFLRTA